MTNYEYIKRETEKETLIKGMSMAFTECGMHWWCDYCKGGNENCAEAIRIWLDKEHIEGQD